MYVFQVKCYVAHCYYSNAHYSVMLFILFFSRGGVAGTFDVSGL